MREFVCIWCGCPLEYKDDVCFEHTKQLMVFRAHIQSALDEDKNEYRKYKQDIVMESRAIGHLIEHKLMVDKSQRDEGDVMSDDQQQQIFKALGIAV